MDISNWKIEDVLRSLRTRETTATEICQASLARIAAENPKNNSLITVTQERALARAAAIDRMAASGERLPPLAGVPVAVKDVIVTEGTRTTCGSRILENYVPPYTATAVERMEAAGAIVVGKANCDEFAMGSSNENSAFGPVRNPYDLERVSGGSSGGSAAAVASGMAVAALGSDTGGSVRQPASFCGVVGLMPTYGRVSRYGLVAYASSLDHIGPVGRSVKDVAVLLSAIAGHDPLDSTSAAVPVPNYVSELDGNLKGFKIGVPREYFAEGLSSGVRTQVKAGLQALGKLGCEMVEITLPHTEYATACYYIIATAEASANLARYDGVRYGYRAPGAASLSEMYQKTRGQGFGAEVKRRIILGTYVLSAGYYDAYYLKAQKIRHLIAADFSNAFEKVDAIAAPTAPTPAFRIGEKTANPLEMYLSDVYTLPGSLAGIPGISVPCGWSSAEGDGGSSSEIKKLPVGIQLLGKHFDEARLLRLAHQFEMAGGVA
ncbi:MAG: Asp-tRNA(Asn)/Glu-tRNA(Gln) amidotransferase subunit GatA [Acidobacteria bacterium]|nr:Asp-tRNA(Asn)/Glu-tRNA(Gln) amidotransferase subunit GatA [Acidobacteriota bacterium]MCZ6752588.1 Asp-tRNA(Asn)/Glu-tRNA(Gln) amidotransferase subunit GatA [Acidobacteriota bacterium]